MTGEIRGLTILAAAASVLALAGCADPLPQAMPDEVVYGPPHLSDWVEIDGRWDVTAAEGGGALLQPATDADPDDGPRSADPARWIDTASGETIWERDDIGAVLHWDDEQLVASVGAGSTKSVAALDLATGETLWSFPESELGECTGWELVAYWDDPAAEPEDEAGADVEGEEADPSARIVMRGPERACRTSERAVLVEIDAATGAVTEILRGRGTITSGYSSEHLTLAIWRSDAASLYFYDDLGVQSSSVDLTPAELVDGTALTNLASPLDLQLEQLHEGRPWLRVLWLEDGMRYILNDFLLDPVEGTATLTDNRDCTPEDTGSSYRYQAGHYTFDTIDLNWCVVGASDASEAQVRTDEGEGTSWTVPRVIDGSSWRVTSCAGDPADLGDTRMLLLGPAPDAQLRAYDLSNGEVLWSLGDDGSGSVLLSTWPDPDRAFVLTDDADGAQLLRTVRLCTGEVLEEREVAGAHVADGRISAVSWVVTVPLGETTLLATFTERGTKPELPDGDEDVDPDEA